MKKIFTLIALLSATMMTAFAKGDIQITTSPSKVAPGETVDVIISMTNAEDEVRGLEFNFTLPEGLMPVGDAPLNEDRVDTDEFIYTPNICGAAEGGSKVTFMSLSGAYIEETEGELFRFSVKTEEEEKEYSFTINVEISYDGGVVDEFEKTVTISTLPSAAFGFSANVSELTIEDEATIGINLDNAIAIGGFVFEVTLPKGLEFVMNSKGKKVNWTFSPRVSSSKSASENKLADNKVKLMVVDAKSNELVAPGEGEIISFSVKATEDFAGGNIVIDKISVSELSSKQHNLSDVVEIVTKANNTTSVSTVKAASANSAIFNLAGQKVNAAKGTVIINGKVLFVK